MKLSIEKSDFDEEYTPKLFSEEQNHQPDENDF